MAQLIDQNNFINLIKNGLEGEVKKAVIDTILKEQMDEFKKKIEPRIRETVEKYSIDGVNCVKDLASFREELKVFIQWKE